MSGRFFFFFLKTSREVLRRTFKGWMLCLCSADMVTRPCRLSFFGDPDIGLLTFQL